MELALQSCTLSDICQPCPLQNVHPSVRAKCHKSKHLSLMTVAVVICNATDSERWEPSHAIARPC